MILGPGERHPNSVILQTSPNHSQLPNTVGGEFVLTMLNAPVSSDSWTDEDRFEPSCRSGVEEKIVAGEHLEPPWKRSLASEEPPWKHALADENIEPPWKHPVASECIDPPWKKQKLEVQPLSAPEVRDDDDRIFGIEASEDEEPESLALLPWPPASRPRLPSPVLLPPRSRVPRPPASPPASPVLLPWQNPATYLEMQQGRQEVMVIDIDDGFDDRISCN